MNLSTDLRKGRTCVFLMHVHLVFVTKCRHNVFTKPILEELAKSFKLYARERDQVHLLVNYLPKVSVSKLVNSLKGGLHDWEEKMSISSRSTTPMGDSLWSPRDFAGACGGAPLEIIQQYIEQQAPTSNLRGAIHLGPKDRVFSRLLDKKDD